MCVCGCVCVVRVCVCVFGVGVCVCVYVRRDALWECVAAERECEGVRVCWCLNVGIPPVRAALLHVVSTAR